MARSSIAWSPAKTPGAPYTSTNVRRLIAPTPLPYTKQAPGAASWCTTRPASSSALATTTTAGTDAGAVVPADGEPARTSGTPSSRAGDRLVAADVVEDQRRRGHGEAGEAAGLATGGRHLVHDAQRPAAEGARGDDGLARGAQHRDELRRVEHVGVDVLGQRHGHHEVDVRELLGERRRGGDVVETAAAALARVGVPHVHAVRAGAVEGARARDELERRRLAAPGREAPRAGGARQGFRDEGARQAHPGALDPRARPRAAVARALVAHLDAGAFQEGEGRVVQAGAPVLAHDPECHPIHPRPFTPFPRRRCGRGRLRVPGPPHRGTPASTGTAFEEELEPEGAEVAAGVTAAEEPSEVRGGRARAGAALEMRRTAASAAPDPLPSPRWTGADSTSGSDECQAGREPVRCW